MERMNMCHVCEWWVARTEIERAHVQRTNLHLALSIDIVKGCL